MVFVFLLTQIIFYNKVILAIVPIGGKKMEQLTLDFEETGLRSNKKKISVKCLNRKKKFFIDEEGMNFHLFKESEYLLCVHSRTYECNFNSLKRYLKEKYNRVELYEIKGRKDYQIFCLEITGLKKEV